MAIERIDEALVARGLAATIDEAKLLVLEGRVFLGEGKVAKPSDPAKKGLALRVRGEKKEYVSRGAYKLKKAFEVFDLHNKNMVCMDVGASTGGFTEIMLRNGAKLVYSIDVGYGQLDYTLRADERVRVMERTNARFLTKEMFPEAPVFGATDVSFISLKAILPSVFSVLEGDNAQFVALIKPQFEAAKEDVGAKGVVRNFDVHLKVVSSIVEFVTGLGWACAGLDFSPITGPEGNIEFLLHISRSCSKNCVNELQIHDIIKQAYKKLII